MIVRISEEGQYEVPASLLDHLNRLDNAIVEAVGRGDEARFRALLEEMVGLVRAQGKALPPEDLRPSDVVLPPPDIDLEEARGLFVGEGLIPG